MKRRRYHLGLETFLQIDIDRGADAVRMRVPCAWSCDCSGLCRAPIVDHAWSMWSHAEPRDHLMIHIAFLQTRVLMGVRFGVRVSVVLRHPGPLVWPILVLPGTGVSPRRASGGSPPLSRQLCKGRSFFTRHDTTHTVTHHAHARSPFCTHTSLDDEWRPRRSIEAARLFDARVKCAGAPRMGIVAAIG